MASHPSVPKSTQSVARVEQFSEVEEAAAEKEWQGLLQRGESLRAGWVRQGLLITTGELAQAWGISCQALSAAHRRGELLSLKIGRNRFYPAVFKTLEPGTVMDVCSRLKGYDVVGKFIFWNRPQGSLDDMTASEAIAAGQSDEVVALADAWTAERGSTP